MGGSPSPTATWATSGPSPRSPWRSACRPPPLSLL